MVCYGMGGQRLAVSANDTSKVVVSESADILYLHIHTFGDTAVVVVCPWIE